MNWLKLSEVKPKQGQLCLVCAKSNDPDMIFRHVAEWCEGRNRFELVSGWGQAISHWMPYPELPADLK